MAPSSTMRASPQGGNFYIRSSSAPPGPVHEECGVFDNRDLSAASWTIVLNLWTVTLFGRGQKAFQKGHISDTLNIRHIYYNS